MRIGDAGLVKVGESICIADRYFLCGYAGAGNAGLADLAGEGGRLSGGVVRNVAGFAAANLSGSEACQLDSGGGDELGLGAAFLSVGALAGDSPDAVRILLGGGDGIDNAVGCRVEGNLIIFLTLNLLLWKDSQIQVHQLQP